MLRTGLNLEQENSNLYPQTQELSIHNKSYEEVRKSSFTSSKTLVLNIEMNRRRKGFLISTPDE